MTYGVITDVAAPAEAYDQIHRALMDRSPDIDGLVLHVARATDEGFQVFEVWESREHFDTANAEVIGPLMAELAGDGPLPPPPRFTEFEVRGMVVPAGSGASV